MYIEARKILIKQNIMLSEFDEKLRIRLQEHIEKNGLKIAHVAKECGMAPNTLYNFSAGNSAPNAQNTRKLLMYLNLTVELKPR